jgi:hypothetical protein
MTGLLNNAMHMWWHLDQLDFDISASLQIRARTYTPTIPTTEWQ